MKLPFHIALKYSFAKKSHNVINIISIISAVGIALGSMALIIILSVYNGFDNSINFINGFFIAGFALLCVGGLSVLSYLGAYDFFSYAFYLIWSIH